jgi:hypothetical protein
MGPCHHLTGERFGGGLNAAALPPAAPSIQAGPPTAFVWPAKVQPYAVRDDVVPLKGFAEDMGNLLARLVVLVIGLGAVGARLFAELARLGIGTLLGADPDAYGAESWQTQPSRRWADTGATKARLQGELAHAANPATTVVTFPAFAQDLPLWVPRSADVIVAAGDNLDVMVWAGVVAASLGKPLLQGAVFGEQWLALVRKYPLANADAACPACSLGTREWSLLTQRHGCDPHTARRQGGEPTRTLPPVCSTAASLLAGEVLKTMRPDAIGGPLPCRDHAAEGVSNKRFAAEEIAYCLASHRVWQTKYLRNPQCRCPHERWGEIDVPNSPDETTLEMLIEQLPSAGLSDGTASSLQVRGESPYVSFTFCSHCGREVPVRRFARAGDVVGRCDCGQPLRAIPLGVRSVIPSSDLPKCLGLPLSDLGVQPGGAVGIAGNEQSTYFFVGQPPHDIVSTQRAQVG